MVSEAEMVAGVRECRGRPAFNVPWCPRTKGWAPGSMVYNKCGYFFNMERA